MIYGTHDPGFIMAETATTPMRVERRSDDTVRVPLAIPLVILSIAFNCGVIVALVAT